MIRDKSLLPIQPSKWSRLARMRAVSLLAVGLMAVPTTASSAMVGPLTFEGLNEGAVGSFYSGFVFSSGAFALIDSDAGGSGSFENPLLPTSSAIMYFPTESSVTVDYAAGFSNALSFYYTSLNDAGSVSIFDGLGGTGINLLGSPQPLTAQDQSGCPSSDLLCVWSLITLPFSGTAMSIVFSGPTGAIGFDNITLDPAPVPLPAAAWLLLSGLAGLGFVGRRRTAR